MTALDCRAAVYEDRPTGYELGIYPLWLTCTATDEGPLRKLDNLYALYELGRQLGALRAMLRDKPVMDSEIGQACLQCIGQLRYIIRGDAVALPRSKESAQNLKDAINELIRRDINEGNNILR